MTLYLEHYELGKTLPALSERVGEAMQPIEGKNAVAYEKTAADLSALIACIDEWRGFQFRDSGKRRLAQQRVRGAALCLHLSAARSERKHWSEGASSQCSTASRACG